MERNYDANKLEWVVTDSQGTEIYRVPDDVARQVAQQLQDTSPINGPFPCQATRQSISSNFLQEDPMGKKKWKLREQQSKLNQRVQEHKAKLKEEQVQRMTDAPVVPPTEPETTEGDLSSLNGAPIGQFMKLLIPDNSSKKGTGYYAGTESYGYCAGGYEGWE